MVHMEISATAFTLVSVFKYKSCLLLLYIFVNTSFSVELSPMDVCNFVRKEMADISQKIF